MPAVEDDRNPLMNPIVGDVVEKGGITRTVVEVYGQGQNILYDRVKGDSRKPQQLCYISTWREWCVKATVIKKAQGR